MQRIKKWVPGYEILIHTCQPIRKIEKVEEDDFMGSVRSILHFGVIQIRKGDETR